MQNQNIKFPQRVTIELTNRCNLSCSFCPRHLVDMRIGDIDEKLFHKIIDECSQNLPVSVAIFFRGESLLYPKIADFIRYAKVKGIAPVQLASNALLLDENMSENLIEAGLDFISFSMDTIDENLYAAGRKNGDLAKSTQNILTFVEKVKKRRLDGKSTPEIQVSTVDISEYRKGQQEFIDFWLKYADRVRVYTEHSADGNLGSINNIELPSLADRKSCKKLYTDMVIYYDGTVAICNHDWDNNMNIGNIQNQSIAEVWNSQNYNKIRSYHEDKDSFTSGIICDKCDHWKMYYTEEQYLGKLIKN